MRRKWGVRVIGIYRVGEVANRLAHTVKGENPMRMFVSVCRCGKRSCSTFEHNRHVKYMCTLKHVPLETIGKGVRIMGPAHSKGKK